VPCVVIHYLTATENLRAVAGGQAFLNQYQKEVLFMHPIILTECTVQK
jgi:hypothetical protein